MTEMLITENVYRAATHLTPTWCRFSTNWGGATGIRTPDLLHAMQTRYQLRHSPLELRNSTGGRTPNQTGPDAVRDRSPIVAQHHLGQASSVVLDEPPPRPPLLQH